MMSELDAAIRFVTVTTHAIDRARERILSPLECFENGGHLLRRLWEQGLALERWADPDDPPGASTITREVTTSRGPGYLVGRLNPGGHLALISALTAEQYRRNTVKRWTEPPPLTAEPVANAAAHLHGPGSVVDAVMDLVARAPLTEPQRRKALGEIERRIQAMGVT